MTNNNYCAEIIESTTATWIAQSWQKDNAPLLGSLVIIHHKEYHHLGIVCEIQTGSIEPGRQPFAYQKNEETLFQEQPQIFEFLRTTFTCISVGHIKNDITYYFAAPAPPKIHSFVALADYNQAEQFFAHESYLYLLYNAQNVSCRFDELLLALITYRKTINLLNTKNLELLIKAYAILTGNDYRRIRLFLQRVQPLL